MFFKSQIEGNKEGNIFRGVLILKLNKSRNMVKQNHKGEYTKYHMKAKLKTEGNVLKPNNIFN